MSEITGHRSETVQSEKVMLLFSFYFLKKSYVGTLRAFSIKKSNNRAVVSFFSKCNYNICMGKFRYKTTSHSISLYLHMTTITTTVHNENVTLLLHLGIFSNSDLFFPYENSRNSFS